MKYWFIFALGGIAASGAVSAQDPARTKAYIDAGFAAMDADKDGKVVPAEFDRFMRARLARQTVAFDAAFAQLDADGSGTISTAEAAANSQLASNFGAVDTDRNGAISKNELRAAMLAAQATEMGAS